MKKTSIIKIVCVLVLLLGVHQCTSYKELAPHIFLVKENTSFLNQTLTMGQPLVVEGQRGSQYYGYIYVNGEKATGKYLKEILSLVNRDFSGNGYYTQMAAGWLLAECFVTFPARIWEFLADKEHLRLDNVSYRKAVNKICESLTPDKEVKAMVRRL